ncbi:hypothetical protein [Myroides marinus]|uniref:hypothetical protein n=1 Tax=Myroides marinus TaxID=703342 RepID=UPI0025750F16|nr:hypothetical protein [Myroides marinus]MDM1378195.1 hypothetical protein [Myroides marinus]MDM1385419.1 hypothetical protein [Myroides marinus]MDM1392632.1 hypothetical protein [Myroides marinus]
MTLTISPTLAYEDFMIFHGDDCLLAMREAINDFMKVVYKINQFNVKDVSEYIVMIDDIKKLEVLTICYLVDNLEILNDIKEKKEKRYQYIKSELKRINTSISLMREDFDVVESLNKTKDKWVSMFVKSHSEVELSNTLLSMLMLIKNINNQCNTK